MSSITSTLAPATPNRRRRVRHKIQTPAYASFTADPNGTKLDLHEIVDISEEGMAIQCHSPLDADSHVNLCLDLADCAEHIYTTGQVIWSNDSGRAGLRFSDLPAESLSRLREWLFVNVMAGVANGEAEIVGRSNAREDGPPRPSYTDALAAVSVLQRQVEALGSDLTAALRLIAERAKFWCVRPVQPSRSPTKSPNSWSAAPVPATTLRPSGYACRLARVSPANA